MKEVKPSVFKAPSLSGRLNPGDEGLPSINLNHRQLCDLELILNGGFAPLSGFMGKQDYLAVLEDARLADGSVWPMPITLDLDKKIVDGLNGAERVLLRDLEGFPLAILSIAEIWEPDKVSEAHRVFGTDSTEHPGVSYLLKNAGTLYVAGTLQGIALPRHYDFRELRRTPAELRQHFQTLGASQVVAFQTRNPMHRAHVELTHRAAEKVGGHLLVHPVVGMTKPGDVDHFTRVRCYQQVMKHYAPGSATLSLLPLAMRMAGPREALWHALIRKNHGVTHFIVGRDHAGPGKYKDGRPFYGAYEAQELLSKFSQEIGVQMVPFRNMVYVKELDQYFQDDEAPKDKEALQISGTELRGLLAEGKPIPPWLSYPTVIEELRRTYPANSSKGVVLFLSGLPSSGKSTLANAIAVRLMEIDKRQITLLDGDIVRKFLTSELGFSRQDRATQVRRVGFIAGEIAKHGGAVICALIAPYTDDRQPNREMISQEGEYVEIFVSTPVEICEKRDPKGLYAKARSGLIKGFTGVDDPYEAPQTPELNLDMNQLSVEQGVEKVVQYLRTRGIVA